MADPLSTTFLVGNGFSTNGLTNVDMLIQAYRRTRQPELDALTSRQNALTQRRQFFTTLRSKLEALQAAAQNFLDSSAAARFQARSVTVSDSTVLSATAADGTPLGSASVKVNRLASNDTLLSAQRTLSGAAGLSAGVKTFTISGRSYTITLSGTETYQDLMNAIANAINADSNAAVTASVVTDGTATGRLSLVAKSTGDAGAITFSDPDSVLGALGLDASIKQTTGTTTLSVSGVATQNSATISFPTSGNKRFTINGVTVYVYVSSSQNAVTLINNIVSAINAATGAGVQATNQQSGELSKLVITNTSPGGTLSIVDNDGVLSALGIPTQTLRDERTVATATKAGYAKATTDELNASITVGGVEVVRQSNTITDVLPGVTLTLLKAQQPTDAPVSIKTSVGTDNVADTIKPLLDAYNDALTYIQNNLKTVGSDAAVRSLRSTLRSLASRTFSGTLTSLADVGIKIASDGTLTVDNKDRLRQQLENDPSAVAALFTSSGGFANAIVGALTGLIGSDGLLQARTQSLAQQIQRVSDQQKALQARIDRDVERQRREYTKLQELYYSLQSQMSQYSPYLQQPQPQQ